VVLLSTVLVQVPRHARLAEENSTEALREVVSSLVSGNWVRTAGWSARAVLAGVIVAAA
jgi:hypothetical protein